MLRRNYLCLAVFLTVLGVLAHLASWTSRSAEISYAPGRLKPRTSVQNSEFSVYSEDLMKNHRLVVFSELSSRDDDNTAHHDLSRLGSMCFVSSWQKPRGNLHGILL